MASLQVDTRKPGVNPGVAAEHFGLGDVSIAAGGRREFSDIV
jgi:hypothetical protein